MAGTRRAWIEKMYVESDYRPDTRLDIAALRKLAEQGKLHSMCMSILDSLGKARSRKVEIETIKIEMIVVTEDRIVNPHFTWHTVLWSTYWLGDFIYNFWMELPISTDKLFRLGIEVYIDLNDHPVYILHTNIIRTGRLPTHMEQLIPYGRALKRLVEEKVIQPLVKQGYAVSIDRSLEIKVYIHDDERVTWDAFKEKMFPPEAQKGLAHLLELSLEIVSELKRDINSIKTVNYALKWLRRVLRKHLKKSKKRQWHIVDSIYIPSTVSTEDVMALLEELAAKGHARVKGEELLLDEYALDVLRRKGVVITEKAKEPARAMLQQQFSS